MCFIDEHHDVFVYNPVDDLLTQIPAAASLVHVGLFFRNK